MIARFSVLLPFTICIPKGETFINIEYEAEGYKIEIFPPRVSDIPPDDHGMDQLLINDAPAILANSLIIDFYKDDFNREKDSAIDPPMEFLELTINSFLEKLRFVTRGSKIRPLNLEITSWKIDYLADDGNELPYEEGKNRGRGSLSYEFSWVAIDAEVWNAVNQLDEGFVPPKWDGLLIDAQDQIPNIGTSIVLSATALEVLIATVLDRLARESDLPEKYWIWINNRPWLSNPSVEEQFDSLLKMLLGWSLKEESDMWEKFKNLKSARNQFVHTGTAKVGSDEIGHEQARILIEGAVEIVRLIMGKLPEDHKPPEFNFSIRTNAKRTLLGPTKDGGA